MSYDLSEKSEILRMKPEEKLDKKTDEYIRVLPSKKQNYKDFQIEIVERQKMDNGRGIEIFARVWDKNTKKQFGFGKDGTVDIERFRIHMDDSGKNSQYSWMVVPDSKGAIIIDESYEDINGILVPKLSRYRYDPEQALVDFIEKVIRMKRMKFSDENIERGKVGNTSSSFTSVSGGDGRLQDSSTSWSTVRNDTSAASVDSTETDGWLFCGDKAGSDYIISRSPIPFDTSGLPDTDTIDSATIDIRQASNAGEGDRKVVLVNTTTSSDTSLTAGDFDNFGATEGSTARITMSSADTDFTFTLNATGEGWINKTGYSKFGLRGGYDFDNTTPSARNYTRVTYADHATSAYRPTLTVEHSAGGGATFTPRVTIF